MNYKENEVNYGTCGKYSFGGVGFSMTNMLILTYLTFFCTDIFGISSMTVAGLMLITQIIDAVTDPLMGLIADHTRTKWGRYRPYLMFGAPVLGICIYLLFSAPELSQTMKIVFIYVAYIAYTLAFTVVGVTFTALAPIVGKTSRQTTTIVSWKNVMIQVGRTVITVFSLPIVEALGGGKTGWGRYGMLVGVIITLCFWMVVWSAKPYDTVDLTVKRQKINFKSEVHLITKNKSLLMLMIAFGTDMLANSALLAANMYYFKYVLGREDLVPSTSLALTLTGIVTNVLLPQMVKKTDKKKLYWLGSFFSILPLAVLFVKPVLPASGILVLIAIYGLISAIPSALAWVMLTDCTNYSEYITGVEGSGVISSTFMFINKVFGALGSSLTSYLLAMAGFVANQGQSKTVLAMIVFLRFGTPILGYIASVISMCFYDLTEDKVREVRTALAERKGNA